MPGRSRATLPKPRPVGDAEAKRLAPFLAQWAYAAGASFEDWRFGSSEAALDVLREWVLRPGSELAAGWWRICEIDGRPAGGVAFLPGDRLELARRTDLLAMARLPTHATIGERLSTIRDLFGAVSHDDLYLSRIAVDPGSRGIGLGRHLLDEVVTSAAEGGHPRVRLDVSADNESALRFYERAGFSKIAEAASSEARLRYLALELRV